MLRYKKKNPGKDWLPTLQKLEQSTVIVSTGATRGEVQEWLEQNHGTPTKDTHVKVTEESGKEKDDGGEGSSPQLVDNADEKNMATETQDTHRESTDIGGAVDQTDDETRDEKTTENETSFEDEFYSDVDDIGELVVKPFAGHSSDNSGKKD